jgi:hypothetical protein
VCNTSGIGNIAIGNQSLNCNTVGCNNIAIGRLALFCNTASNNTAVGLSALRCNTTGANNTAVGTYALSCNLASNNTAVGFCALRSNTTGIQNVALGLQALRDNTTGSSNTAIGLNALVLNSAGYNNTAIGTNVLFSNTTGNFNVAVGYRALFCNTASNNTAVGLGALRNNTTGANNIAIGTNSGTCITSGACNVVLGGATANGFGTESGNIFISDGAGNIRLFATGSTGFVGINTTTPLYQLDVSGSSRVTPSLIIGEFATPAFYTTTQSTAGAGSTVLYSVPTSSYNGAFFDYTVHSESVSRAGQIMSLWSGSEASFTETTTVGFGDTSGFVLSVTVSSSDMILSSSAATAGWDFKSIVRSI